MLVRDEGLAPLASLAEVALERPEDRILVEVGAAVPVDQLALAVLVVVRVAVLGDVVVRVGPDEELVALVAVRRRVVRHVGGAVLGLAQRRHLRRQPGHQDEHKDGPRRPAEGDTHHLLELVLGDVLLRIGRDRLLLAPQLPIHQVPRRNQTCSVSIQPGKGKDIMRDRQNTLQVQYLEVTEQLPVLKGRS